MICLFAVDASGSHPRSTWPSAAKNVYRLTRIRIYRVYRGKRGFFRGNFNFEK